MIRATGGSACAATTTTSRSRSRATPRASSFVLIPSCEPSSPISRTREARMFSFSASLRGGRGGSGVNRRLGLKDSSPSCASSSSTTKTAHAAAPFPRRLDSVEPHVTSGAESGGEERVRSFFSGSQGSKVPHELVQRFRRLLPMPFADCERLLRLAVAVDDHERNLL